MKTRGWLVATILLCTIAPFFGAAQCGTVHTMTYDTTITGGGNNDEPYEFTFPQFPSSLGTLTNVNISAVASLNYTYDVENTVNTSNLYRQRLARLDNIYSSALLYEEEEDLSFFRNFPSTPPPNQYYSHSLAANDGNPGAGPDFAQNSLQLLNNFTLFSANVNTANFMGVGNVTLDYFSTTDVTINKQAPVDEHSTITDQITVSITYTYCDNILLQPGNNPRIIRQLADGNHKNKLFPNPSLNGNFSLQFHESKRADWQVEVFNSTGQLIHQNKFYNTLRADVNDSRLSKGIYIIKSTNIKSQEFFTERLLVK